MAIIALVVWQLSPFPLSIATQVSADSEQPPLPSYTASPIRPAIEGWVKSLAHAEPVAGAHVVVNGVAHAVSDAGGYFALSPNQLAAAGLVLSNDRADVQVQVLAEGYAGWSLPKAVYYSADTLRLYPKLTTADDQDGMLRASSIAAERPLSGNILSFQANSSAEMQPNQFGAQSYGGVPASIRVYRTQTGAVEVVPFREYLKHVLPNEWIPTWSANSLRAGAIAVKSYAWFWVAQGGKQSALGADVKDNTDDQVYDPNVSYASTDAAVDATFQYSLLRDGSLFQTQYCAGSYTADPSGDCPWSGPYMTQWGSAYHSDQGRSWTWILRFYYPGAVISPTPPGSVEDAPAPTRQPAANTPTALPTAPPVAPMPGAYAVGQGAPNSQPFLEAYTRNGDEPALGRPTGPVRWWLTQLSENNLLVQSFSGPAGQGNVRLVYDTLKSTQFDVRNAYLLTGEIASAYGSHQPPGPEWVGAPTSDPYSPSAGAGGIVRQSFTGGTLTKTGSDVQFAPWPQTFADWKAEYFVGHPAHASQAAPPADLPGQPVWVQNTLSPNLAWVAAERKPQGIGAGGRDWSVQFTQDYQSGGGIFNMLLSADSGARLWVDDLLAINGWQWTAVRSEKYSADLPPGLHKIRVQYFSPGSSAQLTFSMQPQTPKNEPASSASKSAPATAQLKVRVRWLGVGSTPNDNWARPLTLSLSAPGAGAVLGTYPGTTDRTGTALYTGLPAGVYDVHVKGLHSIQAAMPGVNLTPGASIDLDMGVQVEGDLDGDNCVTIDDLSLVQQQLGLHQGMAGYNPAADLNNDGRVTMSDLSLLRSGFDKCGDIWVGSLDRQTLAAWLQPESQTHDLGLRIVSSDTQPSLGQTIEVAVVADTGAQPIDGASFQLKYDPQALAPVGSAGGAVPGLLLPGVMGNWIDAAEGSVGYSAGALQGNPPAGQIVVARLRFRVIAVPTTGRTRLDFNGSPETMQLTGGGANLLGSVRGVELTVQTGTNP